MSTIRVLAFVAAFAAPAAAADLPRYKLEPGMELTYAGSSNFRYQNGSHNNEDEVMAWVTRRHDDGSVRVIMRQGSRFTATRDGTPDAGAEEPMEYNVGYFDLYPDGRLGPDAELGYRVSPETFFPQLPDKPEGDWAHQNDKMGQEHRYSSLRPEGDGFAFTGERIGPENTIYESTYESTYHFDAARGLVKRIDMEFTQGYGFQGKGTGEVELAGLETRDGEWMASLSSAADRYFAASRAYEKATEEASESADRAAAILADAKATLEKAAAEIDHPVFNDQLKQQIASHDGMVDYHVDNAKRRAEVLGQPAADWELEDLAGQKHALSDYRGKVVVLDFWYRGCGWCIKAMPQLNALAEEYEGRPVAVLGMNTDRVVEDAEFVRDAMGLKYETLRAEGIPEKYGVQGFPTLIVIDPEGKVSDIHVGYSPTLKAEVSETIKELLPAN